jgi:hypothetical protein
MTCLKCHHIRLCVDVPVVEEGESEEEEDIVLGQDVEDPEECGEQLVDKGGEQEVVRGT